MNNPFQMSGASNAGAGFSSMLRKRLGGRTVDGAMADEGQARKFEAGLARQREINAGNFPVKREYSQLGTMGPSRLASRESQAATGKPMGSMAALLASRKSQGGKPQVAGQSKPYGADFMGPVPTGGVREAGLLPAPVLDEQTGAQWSGGMASPAKTSPGRGFAAYLDEQMGGTGYRMSGRDGKAGFVAQDGPFRGQTRQAAMSGLRAKFLGMSPEERAKYDQQAEVLSGVAGRPEAPAQSVTGAVAAETMAAQQGQAGPKRKGLIEEPDPNAMDPDEDWWNWED